MVHDLASRAPACTADEALARLVAGNKRFVAGHARFPTIRKELLAELAKEQHPYAPEGKARMKEGILKLVGAVYELKTGRVRFLQ